MRIVDESSVPFQTPKQVEEVIGTYLDQLARKSSTPTYYSHKTALSEFQEWYLKDPTLGFTKRQVRLFFEESVLLSSRSIETIRNVLNVVANFLAFGYEEDPLLVKTRILSCLLTSRRKELRELGRSLVEGNTIIDRPERELLLRVESLISYLREHCFGTRTHTFVELALATSARPEQIRLLDRRDIDTDREKATIGLADTHIVAQAGLVSERTTGISPKTADALKSYIQYDRHSNPPNGCEALLTTPQGRASLSTLRRSVKRRSRAALTSVPQKDRTTQPPKDSSNQEEGIQPVVPADVWKYSLSRILRSA